MAQAVVFFLELMDTKCICVNNPNDLLLVKKRWAALPAEQKQVILDQLKRHREARKKV